MRKVRVGFHFDVDVLTLVDVASSRHCPIMNISPLFSGDFPAAKTAVSSRGHKKKKPIHCGIGLQSSGGRNISELTTLIRVFESAI